MRLPGRLSATRRVYPPTRIPVPPFPLPPSPYIIRLYICNIYIYIYIGRVEFDGNIVFKEKYIIAKKEQAMLVCLARVAVSSEDGAAERDRTWSQRRTNYPLRFATKVTLGSQH